MEKRMLEDKVAYREDIDLILEQLDGISNKTSDVSYKRKAENEYNVTNGRTKVKIDDFLEIVKKAMREEKQHIRDVLNEVQVEAEHIRNDFIDMESKVLKHQTEQVIMLQVLKGDFMRHVTEMQTNYKELERTVANNAGNIEKLLSKQRENQLSMKIKEIGNANELLNFRIDELVKKLHILSLQMCSASTWASYGTSCYYVGKDDLTWDEAFNKCASLGAKLVQVDSEAENTFLVNLAKEKRVGGFGAWLGGTDRETEGLWIWDTSGKEIYNIYSNFVASEPNGGTAENCLHFYKIANWKWNDNRCDRRMGYICEKEYLTV